MKANILLLLCVALPGVVLAQGSLTPPAAPAPTMKTLDQIEARIPINSLPFNVSAGGSYYLTGSLSPAVADNGIIVDASNVTIDLNGFELIGNGTGTGIFLSGGVVNVTVRNGTIRNWNSYGVNATGNDNVRVEKVVVRSCGAGGLVLDDRASVIECLADGNGANGILVATGSQVIHSQAMATTGSPGDGIKTLDGSAVIGCTVAANAGNGIKAANGCTILNCTALNNHGAAGIGTGQDCTITGCTVHGHSSSASESAGIMTGGGNMVSQCTVAASASTAGTLTNTTGMGIRVLGQCAVERCMVRDCKGDGILGVAHCQFVANTSANNGFQTGTGAGIHATAGSNRVEGNTVTDNDRGIEMGGTQNLIIKNSAVSNGTNYELVAANLYGPIFDISFGGGPAVSGSSSANSALPTTDPWANFSH